MILQKCEMCGKRFERLHEHHIIPWYLSHDDSDSNIMRVCVSCHKKADARFVNLILYGELSVREHVRKRVRHRYAKKYLSSKTLYITKLLKGTYYHDILQYNIRTGRIYISHLWQYAKRRTNKRISSSINNRKKLKKAASVRGQTSLSGA